MIFMRLGHLKTFHNLVMDANIPLTVNEYEEWGNPNEKDYFDYMLSYSPYENLRNGVKVGRANIE